MTVTILGGNVREGELFNINLVGGGLLGTTTCSIDSVPCTFYTVSDDFNATAVAPVDGLLHADIHGINIA